MEGNITGENDERIGLYVYDNNNSEHWIEMKFDGEIVYHDPDAYPDDPEKRSHQGHEFMHQAQTYAKYYVSTETEYGPFEPETRIDRIQRVKEAISALSESAFETYFSDAYTQVIGKHPDIEPPVERPAELEPDDFILFKIHVYLDEGDEIEAVSDIHLEYNDADGNRVTESNTDPSRIGHQMRRCNWFRISSHR